MTKLCIGMDSDGHFMAAKLDNRPKVIELLKEVYDGDYWENTGKDVLQEFDITEEELLTTDDNEWTDFVRHMEQRGTVEIVTIY